MKTLNDLSDIISISRTGYFLTKSSTKKISSASINSLFKSVSAKRQGNYLFKTINENIEVVGENWTASLCVFAYQSKAPFLLQDIENWYERKLAYLLILESDKGIVILKRGVSGLNDFISKLNLIDYETITSVFVEEDSHLESFVLQNMNISDTALRRKSLSAVNLKDSFSVLGANTYVLQGLRVNNEGTKISVTPGTSRINQLGGKTLLKNYAQWCSDVFTKINKHKKSSNFLSVFSKPVSFQDYKQDLNPIAILFDVNSIIELRENGLIEGLYYRHTDGVTKTNVEFDKAIDKFKLLFDVEEHNGKFVVLDTVFSDLEVKVNNSSISLKSSKARNYLIVDHLGNEKNLVDFINQRNDIIVSFDKLEYIYSKRKLFTDSRLLESIPFILSMLKPLKGLNTTQKEKNILKPTPTQTEFELDTVFRVVEDQFMNKYDFFICDDTNDEWADHIGLSSGKISFYHSKSKKALFSASAFHDVIGQAQKNYGNVLPSNSSLQRKKEKWEKNWSMKGPTSIPYLRKGSSVDEAIELWQKNAISPNQDLEVNIVVDFISKSGLEEKLELLKEGIEFPKTNQVIQILWYLTTLLATSQEQNMKTYIICKP